MKALISVHGMTCGSCVDSVEKQALSLDGVETVEVSLLTEECTVKFDSCQISTHQIIERIEGCGFDAELISEDIIQTQDKAMTEGTFHVGGMTCGSCVNTVKKKLSTLAGVVNCDVSIATEECKLKFDPESCSMDLIKLSIEECGFEAKILSELSSLQKSNEKQLNLKIFGMNCGSCSSSIENEVSKLTGVRKVMVSLASEESEILYDAMEIGVRDIIDKIEELGFEAVIADSLDNSAQLKFLSKTKEIQFWKRQAMKAGFISVIMMTIYMSVPMFFPRALSYFPYTTTFIPGLFYRDVIGFLLTTYVQFSVGTFFFKAAWISLKHGSGTMDTLIGLSTTCAYTFSVFSIFKCIINRSTKLPNVIFDTATMLFTFISVGKLLENKAKAETSTALSRLISLTPSTCTIRETDGNFRNIPIELLQPNDIVEVMPGMKIPADGVVVQNETEVDESLITGESILVPKRVGSTIIGGSINGPGHFFFKATRVGEDTKLANIINAMKKAQLSKAPIQKYADRIAGLFVPLVIVLAVLTFITWFAISSLLKNPPAFFKEENGKFFACLQISISVVIVACPCALGLAAPTAIMVGTGVGANNGVLIKGGDILEYSNDLNICLFDKTGTLTTGQMTVQKFLQADHKVEDIHWKMIALCESISEHPIAKAISSFAEEQIKSPNMFDLEITDENILIGEGISAIISDKKTKKEYAVTIGNGKLLNQKIENNSTLTVSYVSINDVLVGTFEITDKPRSDAHLVINYLQNRGVRCCMVTGDTSQSALKVAQEVGISANDVFSEISPEEKREIVIKLQEGGNKRVAFVGDGINDSPALVEADLGVSISTGTDIAIEAADIVILDGSISHDSLKSLVYALDIAQKTLRRVRVNFFWAFCYNTMMIPIAMGVLVPWGITLHPMLSGAAMAMSSLSVISSSLLLNRWKRPSLELDNPHKKAFWPSWLRLSRPESRNEDIELEEGLLGIQSNS